MTTASVTLFLSVLSTLVLLTYSTLIAGHYQFNDPLPIRVSNVAPFHNPTEKYPYDRLPWPCKPPHPHPDKPNLGAIINGEVLRDALYQIHFQRSSNKQTVCGEKKLSAHDVNVCTIHLSFHIYPYTNKCTEIHQCNK